MIGDAPDQRSVAGYTGGRAVRPLVIERRRRAWVKGEARGIGRAGVTPAPRAKSVVREYAEALIIAVLLALVIRTFVVQAFKIPSGSMLPTLQIGDHILVNKFLYYFQPVRRGDIIVFKFPQDETRDFIKRVIGLPGDTVRFGASRS